MAADKALRVLVVGDTTPAIEAAQARLSTRAFEIITVESYATAADLAAAGAADVVMLSGEEALNFSRRYQAPALKLGVRKEGSTVLLAPDEIFYVSARNKTTFVHTEDAQYIADLSLDALEERFAGTSLIRVHRSYMVNLDHVRTVAHGEKGYVVTLDDTAETQVNVSRRQTRLFKAAVGL